MGTQGGKGLNNGLIEWSLPLSLVLKTRVRLQAKTESVFSSFKAVQ